MEIYAVWVSECTPTFQRLMAKVLKSVLGKIALVYIDDVLVYAKSIDELIENLRIVLNLIKEAGLKVKPKKCELFNERIDFLGHEVSDRVYGHFPVKLIPLKTGQILLMKKNCSLSYHCALITGSS